MGALTTKSFPFELRGWDIEKFKSLDPTDSFGSNTKVYINKDQVVLIEPDYNIHTSNVWLTDKGRQFFDGIFNSWNSNFPKTIKNNSWVTILDHIIKNIYILDHCNNQQSQKKFMTIVFENLSLEIVNILLILSNSYSFIKLRRAENFKIENDLETFFQLNNVSDKKKLSLSTLCLLISTNTRYEGFCLNLNLRQRFLKGNFECLGIGSLIDLTFPVTFLGSHLKILKSITEGNNLFCQNFKFAKKPLIVFNNEMTKRSDSNTILNMLKVLNYSYKLNSSWNGLNLLSASLSETGTQSLMNFLPLNLNDINKSNLLYFINVNNNNISNLKKITELTLLSYSLQSQQNNKIFVDHNYKPQHNFELFNKFNLNSYFYLPTSTFYENEETYINTDGFIKRTTKLIYRKKTKSTWQILKKFLNSFKKKLVFLKNNNRNLIVYNSNKQVIFNNYNYFHYYAIQNLNNLNFFLTIKTTPIIFNNNVLNFKNSKKKIQNTKLKYWLDDFFTNGKDAYSQNSLILTNCSKILRTESTNFF